MKYSFISYLIYEYTLLISCVTNEHDCVSLAWNIQLKYYFFYLAGMLRKVKAGLCLVLVRDQSARPAEQAAAAARSGLRGAASELQPTRGLLFARKSDEIARGDDGRRWWRQPNKPCCMHCSNNGVATTMACQEPPPPLKGKKISRDPLTVCPRPVILKNIFSPIHNNHFCSIETTRTHERQTWGKIKRKHQVDNIKCIV